VGLRTWLDTVESTQSLAVARARAGGAPGDAFIARSQTKGQGRLDHAWVSPVGGLYLSVLAPLPPVSAGLVPIAVGAEIARVLEMALQVQLRVKWPNDLVTVDATGRARKVGGILVDRVDAPPSPVVVVGVGLNVEGPVERFPAELRSRIAFLSELSGATLRRDALADLVLQSVDSGICALDTPKGRRIVVARARARLYGRGQHVKLDGHPAGVLDELADDGALWLADEGRRTEVRAGDLVVLEQP
jgi:BirA family biotin operon repressor/biotin-[acetyl-CoA-carboxylase] ligase